MSHPVIPAPLRFDGDEGAFALRAGATIAYATPTVAPIVERFCAEVAQRTGLRLTSLAGSPESSEPYLTLHGGSSPMGSQATHAPTGYVRA
jgi:hypothetical protein